MRQICAFPEHKKVEDRNGAPDATLRQLTKYFKRLGIGTGQFAVQLCDGVDLGIIHGDHTKQFPFNEFYRIPLAQQTDIQHFFLRHYARAMWLVAAMLNQYSFEKFHFLALV